MPPVELAQTLPVTMERIALFVRYGVYLLLAPLFLLGYFGGERADFWVITAMFLCHNAYVHIVLASRAYRLFFTRLNFFIYLAQITIVVAITGAESSDAYVLYNLLIIGVTAYDRRLRKVMQACFTCLATYFGVIVLEYFTNGISLPLGVIILRLMVLFFVGWMVAALSERLRRTEIISAEQTAQIVSSEATLRAILNSAGDPIVVFDENEYITEANDRAAEFLKLSRESMIGQRFRAFLFDDGTLPHKFANLRARGQTSTEEIAVTQDGDERTVDLVARSFIRDNARYFVVLLRDITDQKNLQEATRLTNIKLERLNIELRNLDKHKSDFIRTIAANLRAPLSAVAGYVDMMLDEELGDVNPDQRKALQTCRRSLSRVFRLIEQTLEIHALRSVPHVAQSDPESDSHADATSEHTDNG